MSKFFSARILRKQLGTTTQRRIKPLINTNRHGFRRSLFWSQRIARLQENRTSVLSGSSISALGPRFFAEFILEQSEGLRMTGLCASPGRQAGYRGVEIVWNFGGLGLYNRVKVPGAELD
jgi:hypothetical protein